MATSQWLSGHVLDVLTTMPDQSVHCCITSPPYFAQRDYGLIGRVWDGELGCAHVWGQARHVSVGRHDENPADLQRRFATYGTGRPKAATNGNHGGSVSTGAFCQRCGAWKGNLGLEPTLDLYVAHLVAIFRELRRVLRDDGTFWLVLGDSYTSGGRATHGTRVGHKQQSNRGMNGSADPARAPQPDGLKPKDLVGVPWRVAFALQHDGWTLRSDVIWHKPNVMPNSQQDRPTTAHEYVFLLAKRERYYYDAEAIKERALGTTHHDRTGGRYTPPGQAPHTGSRKPLQDLRAQPDAFRTKRTVWSVPTAPFVDAHFAVFPPKLITPMILAGTSELGVCARCGTPWRRAVSKLSSTRTFGGNSKGIDERKAAGTNRRAGELVTSTRGWQPTCRCASTARKPSVVLDCFAGSGTTLVTAVQLGRDAIGIDLNPVNGGMYTARMRAGGVT